MCGSKPKVPKIQPVKAPDVPLPPPPPEPTPEAPELNDDRRRQKNESGQRAAKRSGTRSLRIDLLIPGPGSGLNLPN